MARSVARWVAHSRHSRTTSRARSSAGRAVVAIHARRRIPASGVHWRAGVIVAANHTIRRDDDITVTLHDGSTARATLAGRDPGTDLAVLRLESSGSAPEIAELGSDDDLRVGTLILGVGRPGSSLTASLGVISSVGGEWRTWQGGRIDRLVRLDLAIYDGFSGGPLVDGRGRVLGLNTSGLARGAALAVPVSTVNRVADQLLATGRVARGYIGLAMQRVPLPEALVHRLGLPSGVGLMVVSVDPDGPADRAGMLLGDVLLTLDDAPVSDPADVLALLGAERVGQAITVRALRAGQAVTVPVTVGERAVRAQAPRERGR